MYMRSSCAPAHSWHQWFGFVTIYTLLRSIWLLFICAEKICLQATFFMFFKIVLFKVRHLGWEACRGMTEKYACVHAKHKQSTQCISMVDNSETASDSLKGVAKWMMETLPFVTACVSFSTTFFSQYLLLMRSPVSDSELQLALW